ncbi:MAG: hypothetical protein IPK56_03175 [Elusimicrobia bacterium]|nr:hypothetical protein [Elusimicrobiota bacterium]
MKKMTSLEIFNDFTELVKKNFSFLENKGFTVEVGKPVAHEMSIKYSRPETLIRVHYEIGSGPWVTLTQKKGNDWHNLNLIAETNKTNNKLLNNDTLLYAKSDLTKELDLWAKAVLQAI